MRKQYNKPEARKVTFEYSTTVIASPQCVEQGLMRLEDNILEETGWPCEKYWVDTPRPTRSIDCNYRNYN